MPLSKTARYLMFALLYFAQGAITAYFTAINSLYLLSFDLPMTQIGVIGGIALIPFVLKIFLGMLSDRVNLFGLGHRKPFIIIGLLVQAGGLLVVPWIHPQSQFGLFAFMAFLIMTGMALYDTCTDGLALDTTPTEEEGTIQGFMVGGRALGVVAVSGLLGMIAETASWLVVFLILAALALLPLPMVFQIREPARSPAQQFQWSAFRSFSRWPILALGLFGAIYSLVINGALEIFNPFMEATFRISYSTAGLYTMVWGIGVVLGGLSGGRLVDRVGHRRAMLLAVGIAFVSITALSLINSTGMAWVLVAAFGLAYGYYETVYFAVSMQCTNPRIAASMFSILMAIANIGTGIGLAASGALVDLVDFRLTFVIMAGLNLLALLLLPAIFGKRGIELSVQEAAANR